MYDDEDLKEETGQGAADPDNEAEAYNEAMEFGDFGMDNPPPKDEEEDEDEDDGEDDEGSDGEAATGDGSGDGDASSITAEAGTSSSGEAGEVQQPAVVEEDLSHGEERSADAGVVAQTLPHSRDEGADVKDLYKEFAYISQKIRELESTIRTVALSIEESADLVNRVNKSTKKVLDDMQEAGKAMDYKVTSFQDGTETWGADMNRLAANVKEACEDSRGFLGEELKRDLRKSQEDIIRSTIDRVKTESASILMKTRDDYEELLNQVVTNYKQFCKAASQHQRDIKKGYFEETKKLRLILYGVLAAQAFVCFLLVMLLAYRR